MTVTVTELPLHLRARGIALVTSLAALALLVLGPVVALARISSGPLAFFTWAVGVPLLAAASLLASRTARRAAPADAAAPAAVHRIMAIAMRAILGIGAAGAVYMTVIPAVNDVSTTWEEGLRPEFPQSRRIGPPSDEAQARQARLYPGIRTARFPGDPTQAFAAIETFAAAEGWKDGGEGAEDSLCYTAESWLWGFIDDIAIKTFVTAGEPNVTWVEIRSRSRAGRGDRGVNAARVAALIAWLERPGPHAALPG